MTVSGVSGNTPQVTNTAAQQDQAGLNQNFDQFLTLLTTQLKNQDPLSPMDSTQFTNQLVSFSQVEQQIKTNDNLSSLLSAQTLNLTAVGLSFIGKNVESQGDTFKADGTKDVSIGYNMPAAATTGSISILDKDNKVVYTGTPDLTAGSHTLTWDGKDKDGNPVPAGDYTIKIAALNTEGSLNVATYVPGYVESLESGDDGALNLIVDGRSVGLGDVRKVSVAG